MNPLSTASGEKTRHRLDHTMLTSNHYVIRTVDRNVAKEASNNQFFVGMNRTFEEKMKIENSLVDSHNLPP